MGKRKTHEEFIEELKNINPTIEVLEEYITAINPILVKCSICGNIWKSKPCNLLLGSGCPKCGKKKIGIALRKSNDTFVEELASINHDIRSLEEYKGNKHKILFHCNKCGNEWKAAPVDVLAGHGCPLCGYEKQKQLQRLSHEDFVVNLNKVNPDISVLDKYINNHTKIRFQCKNCGHIWTTVPNSVISGHGCPECARSSTSFLEQVIFQAYSMVLGKDEVISRNISLIGMELDIVIPSMKIAYEPGSWRWHYNKRERDTKKREKCKEIGYQLITIYTDYTLDNIPFDNDCYTTKSGLYNSNWNETRCFVEKILSSQNIYLQNDQWKKIQYLAIENSKRKSNEEFIKELYSINPAIEVTSQYLGSSTKVRCKCQKCGNIWEASPDSLLSGHGCPCCGKRHSAELRKKTFDNFILEMANINPNIIFIGKYINTKTKILCECCICGNKWEILPSNLLKGQGCPKCGRKRATEKNTKTQEEFIAELSTVNPNLIVSGQYYNSSTKIELKCAICGFIWNANPMDVLNGHGCPKCNGFMKKTNEQFIQELEHMFPNIQSLEEYHSANEKIHVKCLICENIWVVRPHDLLRSKGCPYCRKNAKC